MPRMKHFSGPEPYGKASPEVMGGVVYNNLGSRRREVLRGPGKGLDNAAISLPVGKVLIVTSDPVSMIPRLGPNTSAWLSVHLIASDYTTSGACPQFAAFTFNFPRSMDLDDREAYLEGVGVACADIGVSIVSGHTGSYPGADFTVIGGGTMFGVADEDAYIDSSMARNGDVVMITKGAAIEATASLSNAFPRYTREKVGPSLSRSAMSLIASCSTVKDAMVAASFGLGNTRISSMHDATEGGVLGALEEMAAACGKSFVVEPGKIPISPEAERVCGAFGLDPLRTMGEGALVLTCHRGAASELENSFSTAGIPVTQIGRVATGRGLILSVAGKSKRYLPGPDRYWAVYQEWETRGLG